MLLANPRDLLHGEARMHGAVPLPQQQPRIDRLLRRQAAADLVRIPDHHLIERHAHLVRGIAPQMLIWQEQDAPAALPRPLEHRARVARRADDAAVLADERFDGGRRIDVGDGTRWSRRPSRRAPASRPRGRRRRPCRPSSLLAGLRRDGRRLHRPRHLHQFVCRHRTASTAASSVHVGQRARGSGVGVAAPPARACFCRMSHLGRNTAYAMGVPLNQMSGVGIHTDRRRHSEQAVDARLLLWKGHCSSCALDRAAESRGFARGACKRTSSSIPRCRSTWSRPPTKAAPRNKS